MLSELLGVRLTSGTTFSSRISLFQSIDFLEALAPSQARRSHKLGYCRLTSDSLRENYGTTKVGPLNRLPRLSKINRCSVQFSEGRKCMCNSVLREYLETQLARPMFSI